MSRLGLASIAALATLIACSSGGGSRSDGLKPVNLQWSQITQDTNGSPLARAPTYRLEYGSTASGKFASRVSVPAGVNRYALRVAKGSWQARVVAISNELGEGAPSNVYRFTR